MESSWQGMIEVDWALAVVCMEVGQFDEGVRLERLFIAV